MDGPVFLLGACALVDAFKAVVGDDGHLVVDGEQVGERPPLGEVDLQVHGVDTGDELAELGGVAAGEDPRYPHPAPGTLHVSRLEEKTAAAGLTLTGAEVARLDALPVTGEREIELGYNWSYGVIPPLLR